jgi:hypothetical protein
MEKSSDDLVAQVLAGSRSSVEATSSPGKCGCSVSENVVSDDGDHWDTETSEHCSANEGVASHSKASRSVSQEEPAPRVETLTGGSCGKRPFRSCGTPDSPPLQEILAAPVRRVPRNPFLPETTADKISQVLAGTRKGSVPGGSVPGGYSTVPPRPRSHMACLKPRGLTENSAIPLPGASPTITMGLDLILAAGSVIPAVLRYLYSARNTVMKAVESTRRVAQQWWYYKYTPGGVGWEKYAPFYWLGHYAEEPEDDNKLYILRNALHLAYARMTSGYFAGVKLAPIHMERTDDVCLMRENDARYTPGHLYVCNNWGSYSTHRREVSLLAALLCSPDSGIRNRDGDDPLAPGTGNPNLSSSQDAKLILNAFNIAEWIIARHQKFGQVTTSGVNWDFRPDNSWKPIFPAVLSGKGGRDRPYTTWPKSQQNHTQLKRAWDESWCLIESGMRFLYKLSFLDPGQIEDMWNFGTEKIRNPTEENPDPFNPEPSFNRGDAELRRRGYSMFRKSNRSVPRLAWTGVTNHSPSMRTWFGVFTPQHFMLVYYFMFCRTMRGEGYFKRYGVDLLRTHFRVFAKNNHPEFNTSAVAHLDGSTDLWAPFFDYCEGSDDAFECENLGFEPNSEDAHRRRTITHELMHYMCDLADGGRPRDFKSSTHCDGRLNFCKLTNECLNLARADSDMARGNINNYCFWLHYRWERWGSDWPPACDEGASEKWHCDPIADPYWHDHDYNTIRESWWRFEALEEKFNQEFDWPW